MIDWLIRGLGLFWFLGGAVAIKAAAEERFFDAAGAALGEGWGRRRRVRAGVRALGALLTTASGAALLLVDRAAPWLMIANLVVQTAWHMAAPRFFPIDDESLPGRTRERNALIVWGAATVTLVAMVLDGAVVLAGNPAAEAAIGVAIVAGMVWQGREILHGASGWRAAAPTGFTSESGEAVPDEPDDTTDAGDGIGPRRWLIAPTIDGLFLVDLDGEDKWFADAVDLPAELKARFEDFEDDVRAALVPHRSIAGLWVLPRATIADFERRAAELATALEPHALAGEAMWWLPPADDVADEDLEPPPHPAL